MIWYSLDACRPILAGIGRSIAAMLFTSYMLKTTFLLIHGRARTESSTSFHCLPLISNAHPFKNIMEKYREHSVGILPAEQV